MEKAKNWSTNEYRFAHSFNENSGEIILSLDRETGEVYHSPSDQTISFQFVELGQDDVVMVCVDQLYAKHSRLSSSPLVLEKFFSTEMIYASVACQSLSVVGLFLVLLTYCLFAELRSLPGKNTMGLVTSLLVAMLLFEVGVARVEILALCTLLGVLIHFALLSAFTWMVICSLHMYRVFAHVLASRHHLQSDSNQQQSRLFVKHVLLSLLVPAVIVGATLAGNWLAYRQGWVCVWPELAEGEVYVGYGRGICYVSNTPSLIAASVVPVCLAVGVNALLFLLTVVRLRHLNHEAKLATQGQRRQLGLYVRMSTLTGINWLVGIATAAIDNVVIWYVFIVLCGLQGFYVFVAFVCNRRVFSLYRALLRCRNQSGDGPEVADIPDTDNIRVVPDSGVPRIRERDDRKDE
ncbi:latrophilin receptor-like protein A [Babylonia areolata]|uniref:latrophilin receptor-like protein A n=1 Tax=Babylonia areolata TaxID=304850 RepID=UPI003FD15A61